MIPMNSVITVLIVKYGRKLDISMERQKSREKKKTMIDKLYVLSIIDSTLSGTDKYLVDFKISSDNRINVAIDGDNGITIDDCIELSRAIENSLNRDEEDFELNVASAGLDQPLKLKRQYKKNIGRDLIVTTFDGETYEGQLVEADDENIKIKVAGKKNAALEPIVIAYADIKAAKQVIHF